MGLVDYSDSSDDEKTCQSEEPRSKRRKVSDSSENGLPPLPSTFRDMYSSTVRTSTRDDPSLHEGRKRVTPHVVGHWPTHVYLEWNPMAQDAKVIREVIESVKTTGGDQSIHSLLQNDLGVSLPLHVSLSRPLALSTAQKEPFLNDMMSKISGSRIYTFTAQPLDIIWHPNEDASRWFLVMRLRRPPRDELRKLLEISNNLARDFGQPSLYQKPSSVRVPQDQANDSFHVSLAWSLKPQSEAEQLSSSSDDLSSQLPALRKLHMEFSQVKIRIGQDVSSCSLAASRTTQRPA